MAKPSPSTSTLAVFAFTTPISSPSALNRPPPELPGLTAASVCMRVMLTPSMVMVRSRPLIMPRETELVNRPRGLPMAYTVVPTAVLTELPRVAAGRFSASILIIARSEKLSVPIRVAGYLVPSCRYTLMLPRPSTTWLLVTI